MKNLKKKFRLNGKMLNKGFIKEKTFNVQYVYKIFKNTKLLVYYHVVMVIIKVAYKNLKIQIKNNSVHIVN